MSELFSEKEQSKIRMNRLRGWIIYVLCAQRPRSLAFSTIKYLLDGRGFPMSSRRLAEELDYLRGEGLLRIFPVNAKNKELSDDEQEKLLVRYLDTNASDDAFCAAIRSKGVHFQEGSCEVSGITRIE